MYCQFCGKQIPDQAKFCPECGADLAPGSLRRAAGRHAVLPCRAGRLRSNRPCRPQGTPHPPPRSASSRAPAAMKWFKFIIYFQLWAGSSSIW